MDANTHPPPNDDPAVAAATRDCLRRILRLIARHVIRKLAEVREKKLDNAGEKGQSAHSQERCQK
jgi:hypothetical protein